MLVRLSAQGVERLLCGVRGPGSAELEVDVLRELSLCAARSRRARSSVPITQPSMLTPRFRRNFL